MRRLTLLFYVFYMLALSLLSNGGVFPAWAEGFNAAAVDFDDEFQLDSSFLSLDAARSKAEAWGDVKIRYKGITLEADSFFLDLEKKQSYAQGDVFLYHQEDLLECDAITYNWEDETGFLEKGELRFEETGYYIQADRLEMTGLDTYRMTRGSFTTCNCPPDPKAPGEGFPLNTKDDRGIQARIRRALFYAYELPLLYFRSKNPWEIRARSAEVELGGYAKIRHALFYVYEIPILYFPWVTLPVKLHRQTGFLVPHLTFFNIDSINNFELKVSLPFFWAINASLDSTLTITGMTKRGVKPEWEFRYHPNKQTKGEWTLNVIDDLEDDRFRYGFKAEHSQYLSNSLYNKAEIRVVSDNAYPVHFPGEIVGASERMRLLESRAILGGRSADWHTTLEVGVVDLLTETGTKSVPQRLPSLHVDMIERPTGLPGVSLGWQSSIVNFMNENEEQRLRGQFSPQAAFLFSPAPAVSLQSRWGVREVVSKGINNGFEAGDSTRHRTLLEGITELETSLGRGYEWESCRLFHIIRPRLKYQWIKKLGADPFIIEMDGLDQLEMRNWLTYSITSRLWSRLEPGDTPGPPGGNEMAADLYIAQSLDLQRDRQSSPAQRLFSDIFLVLRLQPRPYFSWAAELTIDPYQPDLRTFETIAGLKAKNKPYGMEVRYLDHREYTVDALTRVELWDACIQNYPFEGIEKILGMNLHADIAERWQISLNTLFPVEAPDKVWNSLLILYRSECNCWSIIFKVDQTVRPDEIGCSVRFELDRLG